MAPSHVEPEPAPRLECLINDAFFLLSEQIKQPCPDSSARRGCFGLGGRFLLDAVSPQISDHFLKVGVENKVYHSTHYKTNLV